MNINQLTAIKIKELQTKTGLTAEAEILEISRGAYSQMEYKKLEKLSEKKTRVISLSDINRNSNFNIVLICTNQLTMLDL